MEISPINNRPEINNDRESSRRDFLIELGLIGFAGAATMLSSKEARRGIAQGMSSFFQRRTENLNAAKEIPQSNTADTEIEEDLIESELEVLETEAAQERTQKEFADTPKKIADRVLEKYDEVFQKENYLPKEVFTKNFFIATQLQESNFDPKAESHAGAVGIMQVMPITVKEVVRFLHVLKRANRIKEFNCLRSADLSNDDVDNILELIKNNADYGRAFGKLYFADIYRLHKIGKKETEKGDVRGAQKKLLACYNWAPNEFKKCPDNEKKWPKESRDYYKKIFRNMDYLDRFQEKIAKAKIKSNVDYMSMRLVQAMNSYKKIDGESPVFEKLLEDYVKEIKNAEVSRYRKLTDKEIDWIIGVTKKRLMDDYLRYLKDPKLIAKI